MQKIDVINFGGSFAYFGLFIVQLSYLNSISISLPPSNATIFPDNEDTYKSITILKLKLCGTLKDRLNDVCFNFCCFRFILYYRLLINIE